MTGTPAKWTDEEVEKLRELAKTANLSAGAIGLQIGKTRNAIIGKALRLGIRLPGAVGVRAIRAAKVATPRKSPQKPVHGDLQSKVQTYHPEPEPPPSPAGSSPARGQSHFKTCQWFFGDPRAGDMRKCSNPTFGGSSFCEHHHRRVYVPAQPRQPQRRA
jgi:GcrA cell cycle regulator